MSTLSNEPFERLPVGFMTYKGDQRQILNEGPKGPTTFGELVYPVTAEYDPETNKTRVGFSYLAPEVKPHVAPN